MSDFNRPIEVDEAIQIHADTLYQEQLAQDKAADEEFKNRGDGPREAESTKDKEATMWARVKSRLGTGKVDSGVRVGDAKIVVENKDEEETSA